MDRIVAADHLEKTGLALLRTEAKLKTKFNLTENKLSKIIGGFDALIVLRGTKVTRKVIESGKKLKVTVMAGIWIDNIDVESVNESGIFVVKAPSEVTIATAEHTFAFNLASQNSAGMSLCQ